MNEHQKIRQTLYNDILSGKTLQAEKITDGALKNITCGKYKEENGRKVYAVTVNGVGSFIYEEEPMMALDFYLELAPPEGYQPNLARGDKD